MPMESERSERELLEDILIVQKDLIAMSFLSMLITMIAPVFATAKSKEGIDRGGKMMREVVNMATQIMRKHGMEKQAIELKRISEEARKSKEMYV